MAGPQRVSDTEDRVRRSVHEAAHTIVGWLVTGGPPDQLTLNGPEDGLTAGTDYRAYMQDLWIKPGVALKPERLIDAKKTAMLLLAGEQALRLIENPLWEAVTSNDRAMAENYVACIDLTQPYDQSWLDQYRALVRALLLETQVWDLIQGLAAAIRADPDQTIPQARLIGGFAGDVDAVRAAVPPELIDASALPPTEKSDG